MRCVAQLGVQQISTLTSWLGATALWKLQWVSVWLGALRKDLTTHLYWITPMIKGENPLFWMYSKCLCSATLSSVTLLKSLDIIVFKLWKLLQLFENFNSCFCISPYFIINIYIQYLCMVQCMHHFKCSCAIILHKEKSIVHLWYWPFCFLFCWHCWHHQFHHSLEIVWYWHWLASTNVQPTVLVFSFRL